MPADAEALKYLETEDEYQEEEDPSVRRWQVQLPEEIRPPSEKPSKTVLWRYASPSKYHIIGWPDELGARQCVDSLFDFQRLFDFKGDPDDESFVPIARETVERAKRFLICYVGLIINRRLIPIISPGPDGSIDVHWKTPQKELLVNIPADQDLPAPFYGDDYGRLSIEGKLDTRILAPSVVMWLISS